MHLNFKMLLTSMKPIAIINSCHRCIEGCRNALSTRLIARLWHTHAAFLQATQSSTTVSYWYERLSPPTCKSPRWLKSCLHVLVRPWCPIRGTCLRNTELIPTQIPYTENKCYVDHRSGDYGCNKPALAVRCAHLQKLPSEKCDLAECAPRW